MRPALRRLLEAALDQRFPSKDLKAAIRDVERSEMQRGRCRDCGKEVALREDGSARAHTTPDGRAYHPDSEAVAL